MVSRFQITFLWKTFPDDVCNQHNMVRKLVGYGMEYACLCAVGCRVMDIKTSSGREKLGTFSNHFLLRRLRLHGYYMLACFRDIIYELLLIIRAVCAGDRGNLDLSLFFILFTYGIGCDLDYQ